MSLQIYLFISEAGQNYNFLFKKEPCGGVVNIFEYLSFNVGCQSID